MIIATLAALVVVIAGWRDNYEWKLEDDYNVVDFKSVDNVYSDYWAAKFEVNPDYEGLVLTTYDHILYFHFPPDNDLIEFKHGNDPSYISFYERYGEQALIDTIHLSDFMPDDGSGYPRSVGMLDLATTDVFEHDYSSTPHIDIVTHFWIEGTYQDGAFVYGMTEEWAQDFWIYDLEYLLTEAPITYIEDVYADHDAGEVRVTLSDTTERGFFSVYQEIYNTGFEAEGFGIDWVYSILGAFTMVFAIELLPGITIGRIIGVFVIIPLTFAALKLFRGGG